MTDATKPSNDIIESLLFKIVDKPKNLNMVKIVNVFDNRYRINLWTVVEENGLEKNKIKNSYFVRYNDNKLHIIL